MQKILQLTCLILLVSTRSFAADEGVVPAPKPTPYNGMAEVSGVAATKTGYLLVGDDTNDRIYATDAGDVLLKTKFKGFESIDVISLEGREVALILSEDDRTIFEVDFAKPKRKSGAHHKFDGNLWAENCGRGLEGLAVKKTAKEGVLRVAVLWEGGYAQIRARGKKSCPFNTAANNLQYPRIGVFDWQVGKGLIGAIRKYEVATPVPGAVNNINIHQQFRATDLVWYGDALLVMMGTTHIGGIAPYKNNWLQAYCPGNGFAFPNGGPEKLYAADDGIRRIKPRNWEAMDWDYQGKNLVLGFDNGSMKKGGELYTLAPAKAHVNTCSKVWMP